MQIAIRRGGALVASLLAVAVAGVAGTATLMQASPSALAGSSVSGVDQRELVGTQAPDFTLTDLEGKEHTLSDYTKEGKTVVLEWFNPTCPFVRKHYNSDADTMDTMAKEYKDRNVVWLAINSAHEGHKTAALDLNKKMHETWEINHPVLRDTKGTVGKEYGARTTPNMYVIDAQGIIRYAGAIDDNNRAAEPGKTNYVREALDSVLAGETVKVTYSKPYGCSVKY